MKRVSLIAVSLAFGLAVGTFFAGPMLRGQVGSAPVLPGELTSYRDVVKRVLPAVVSIESRAKPVAKKPTASRKRTPFDDRGIPEEFRRFFEGFDLPEVPFDGDSSPRVGFGSGFLIDANGTILTNHHVVDGADEVEVTLSDGRKFTSKDIKSDAKTDLALVRIKADKALPYLELGDSDVAEIGDRVLAVGAPFGLAGTVTHGIISAKGRNLHMNMYESYLQTDAAINPGNSGGPLVNLEGKVIGINSAIKSRSGGFQGIGLAITSNLAKDVVRQLLRDGVVKRGYLGVQIKDIVDRELADRLGLNGQSGVLVTTVFENAPAAKAGLKEGDVITSLGGKPVKDSNTLVWAVAALPLGKPVDLTVLRDGKPVTLKVTVEEQPKEYGTARAPAPKSPGRSQDTVSLESIGVDVADVTPELLEQYGYRGNVRGAMVTQVESGGLAAAAGLQRGTVITEVDRKAVRSANDVRDALEKANLEAGVLLQVRAPQTGLNYVLLKSTAAVR